jgi:hypothetical protein
MAEWSNAAVSKTVVLLTWDRGFESPSLRHLKLETAIFQSFVWLNQGATYPVTYRNSNKPFQQKKRPS